MPLMFDKNDVESASHPLVRILRHIFYKKRITLDEFQSLWAEHGKRLGLPNHINATNRNNARKALVLPDRMSFPFFSKMLYNILHLDIVYFKIGVRDTKTGEVKEYASDDLVE